MKFSKKCIFSGAFLIFYILIYFLYSNNFLTSCSVNWFTSDELEFSYIVTKEKAFDSNKFERKIKFSTNIDDETEELASKELIFISKKQYENGDIQLDETKIKQIRQDQLTYESKSVYKKFIHEKKKYIFALRHYEQLAKATKNFLSLSSLATDTGRHLVMPFVNNSRFCGLKLGLSFSRFLEAKKLNLSNDEEYKGNKFSELDRYFNVDHLHSQMSSHGYSSLVTFKEFSKECKTLDVVIHFLYNDSISLNEFSRWYQKTNVQYEHILDEASKNNGWIECSFVKQSQIAEFLNVKVNRYVCVNPEIIKTSNQLENLILKGSQCVGIVSWKGNGVRRTHFPISPFIKKQLHSYDIQHSQRLIDIAYDYVKNIMQQPFISIHVRSERHLLGKGFRATRNCIQQLCEKIRLKKATYKIFLANDLKDGSDTLVESTHFHKRNRTLNYLIKELGNPHVFHASNYGLYDRGEIAIVEMNILSMGESLFTLGGGNFQEWIEELFIKHSSKDRSHVIKTCSLPNTLMEFPKQNPELELKNKTEYFQKKKNIKM